MIGIISPRRRHPRSIVITGAIVIACIIGTALGAFANPLQEAVDRFRNRAVPLGINWVNAGMQVGLSVGSLALTFVAKGQFETFGDVAQATANLAQWKMASDDMATAHENALDQFRMSILSGLPADQASVRFVAAINFAQTNFTNATSSLAISVFDMAGRRRSTKEQDILLGITSLQLSIQNYRTATEFMISDGNAAGMELQSTVRALYPPPPPLCSSLFIGPTNCIPPAPTVTCTPPKLPPMYGSGLSLTFGSPTPPWCTIANAGTVSGVYDPLNVNTHLVTPLVVADASGRFEFQVGTGEPSLVSSGTVTILSSPGTLDSTSVEVDVREDPQYCDPDYPITTGFAVSATATTKLDPKYLVETPEASPDGVLACADSR